MTGTAARLARLERAHAQVAGEASASFARFESGRATRRDVIVQLDLGRWRRYLLASTSLVAAREAMLLSPRWLGIGTIFLDLSRVVAFPPDEPLPTEILDSFDDAAWIAADDHGAAVGLSGVDQRDLTAWVLALGDHHGLAARHRAWTHGTGGWRVSDLAASHAAAQMLVPDRQTEAFFGVRLSKHVGEGDRPRGILSMASAAEILATTDPSCLVVAPPWKLRPEEVNTGHRPTFGEVSGPRAT